MRFSIIMPVYNSANDLQISVESIISQTYEDWELILVNDGSNDNSLDICMEYSKNDRRIIVVDQNNMGASAARNKGMDNATGEYIIFCDSDDILEVTALQYIEENLQGNSKVQIAFFGYYDAIQTSEGVQIIEAKSLPKQIYDSNNEFKIDFIKIWDKSFVYPVWNKVYLKSFVLENRARFPEKVSVAEDYLFNIPMYININKSIIIDKCLYTYVHHYHYFTKSFNENKFEQAEVVYKYAKKELANWNCELINLIQNAYIKDINIFINNMFNDGVELSFQEKRKLIKEIVNNPSVCECVKNMKANNSRNQIMKTLLKYKLVLFLLIVGRLTRPLRKLKRLMNNG